jgi:hypothetical protein
LVNLLVERKLRADAFPTRYVGFIDMLGFSALTKEYPGSMTLEVGDDYSSLTTGTSKSAERFSRFHALLDRMAANQLDASHPERMMIFSDCAFAVYDNALQAAVSLADLMRTFVSVGIPVRMGIGKGTCHFERFGIDTYQQFSVTRSMFYGSAVVYATEAEKVGKGCRIFLHRSFHEEDLARVRDRYPLLDLATPTHVCGYELNYLHEEQPAADVLVHKQPDHRIWVGLAFLRSELKEPVDPGVLKHYDDSFAAFNAMRRQRGREIIAPPVFSPQK